MIRPKHICIVAALCGTVATQSMADQWRLHTSNDVTVELHVADSVVAVQLDQGSGEEGARDLALRRPELRDTYEPWHLGNGFYVFGVEPGLDVATVLVQLRTDTAVRITNPVAQVDSAMVYWMTDLLAVQFHARVSREQIDSINAGLASFVNPPDPARPGLYWVRIRPDLGLSALEVAESYFASGLCRYAQPDLTWRWPGILTENRTPTFALSAFPDTALPNNDPYYDEQWNWRNTGVNGGLADADVDADSAWGLTTGNPAVRVAIVDIGFQTDHDDFDSVTPIFGFDQAGWSRGLVQPDSSIGIQCRLGEPKPNQDCGHGTAVFGMLAAAHNNQKGLRGLAPRCTYWLIKGFDDDGLTRDSILTVALRYAWKDARCQIVSNSWYWQLPFGPMTMELQEMRDSGIATFFCAGNQGNMWYPALLPTVTAVGATDRRDTICSGSGRGQALDFVAPGLELWTVDMMGQDGYVPNTPLGAGCADWNYLCSGYGTSLATPIAAGVAALILSYRPDFMDSTDPAGIIQRILVESAEDKGPPGFDTLYGHGRINAYRALQAACNCPQQGDVVEDGLVDVFDLIREIAIAFSGGTDVQDPGCPTTRGDVINDDYAVDVYDVIQEQFIVFRGSAVQDPCAP